MKNIDKKVFKNKGLIIGIIILLFGFFLGIYNFINFTNNNQEKKEFIKNKKNNNLIEKYGKNKINETKIIKEIKKENKNTNVWIFTPKEHKAIIKEKGKDYIIDFKYGVGYVNKGGNIIYGIDPKIKKEREIVKKRIISEIKKFCNPNKMQLKDYGGLEGMKKFFDKLLTYYPDNIFIGKEKIDITQNIIDKYCYVYNPVLKNIIKKAVILSFFSFNPKECRLSIDGEKIALFCFKPGKKNCKTYGRFYVRFIKGGVIEKPTYQKGPDKIPDVYLIK